MIVTLSLLYCMLALFWLSTHAWILQESRRFRCVCCSTTYKHCEKSAPFTFVARPITIIRSSKDLCSDKDGALTEKALVRINVEGPHATNPLFRAEVKKELTFFRGCHGLFIETGPSSAYIVAEGKRAQLDRFLSWLLQFSVPLTKRKPSFQSPSLIVSVLDTSWGAFSGRLKGFQASNNAPDLTNWIERFGEKPKELKPGTDESV